MQRYTLSPSLKIRSAFPARLTFPSPSDSYTFSAISTLVVVSPLFISKNIFALTPPHHDEYISADTSYFEPLFTTSVMSFFIPFLSFHEYGSSPKLTPSVPSAVISAPVFALSYTSYPAVFPLSAKSSLRTVPSSGLSDSDGTVGVAIGSADTVFISRLSYL